MLPPFDLTTLDGSAKDTLILELAAQIEVFGSKLAAIEAQYAELSKKNAELRARLDLPPKTPSHSSLPPSQGQKPQGQ